MASFNDLRNIRDRWYDGEISREEYMRHFEITASSQTMEITGYNWYCDADDRFIIRLDGRYDDALWCEILVHENGSLEVSGGRGNPVLTKEGIGHKVVSEGRDSYSFELALG